MAAVAVCTGAGALVVAAEVAFLTVPVAVEVVLLTGAGAALVTEVPFETAPVIEPVPLPVFLTAPVNAAAAVPIGPGRLLVAFWAAAAGQIRRRRRL
jgi:hypothetical protein